MLAMLVWPAGLHSSWFLSRAFSNVHNTKRSPLEAVQPSNASKHAVMMNHGCFPLQDFIVLGGLLCGDSGIISHCASVATGASRRKSARQVAAPKIFSPDMSGTFKRAKSSHSSDSQAVLEARDKFCKQADTLLSQMKTTSSPATIAQLITKIRQGVSTLSRAL